MGANIMRQEAVGFSAPLRVLLASCSLLRFPFRQFLQDMAWSHSSRSGQEVPHSFAYSQTLPYSFSHSFILALTHVTCLTKCFALLALPRLGFRRFIALYITQHLFASDPQIDEVVGHSYLFLKEQLQLSVMPPHSGILHGTIIGRSSLP